MELIQNQTCALKYQCDGRYMVWIAWSQQLKLIERRVLNNDFSCSMTTYNRNTQDERKDANVAFLFPVLQCNISNSNLGTLIVALAILNCIIG